MAAVRVLVDTDILIDYFKAGRYGWLLEDRRNRIYYSAVTRKEFLTKQGLTGTERRAIEEALHRFRLIPLVPTIAARYSELRGRYRNLEKGDALIAATALVRGLPLTASPSTPAGSCPGGDAEDRVSPAGRSGGGRLLGELEGAVEGSESVGA